MAYKFKSGVKASKLKLTKIDGLIRAFCVDLSISEAARKVGVSRQTTSIYYKELMRRMVDDQIVNGGVWDQEVIDQPEEFWVQLYKCIYECEADRDLDEFPIVLNKEGNRKAFAKRHAVRKTETCIDKCRFKLNRENFSYKHYQGFWDMKWKNRRLSGDSFRDVYWTKIFRLSYMDYLTDGDCTGTLEIVTIEQLFNRYKKSFSNNPEFVTR